MTAPDLKPCPFCGGEAYLRSDVSHSKAYFIGCSTVDCFGEIHWGQTKNEAIAGWNTRADLIPAMLAEAVQAEREACAEMVDEMALAARKSYDVLCDVDHAAKISAAILADEFARLASAILALIDGAEK